MTRIQINLLVIVEGKHELYTQENRFAVEVDPNTSAKDLLDAIKQELFRTGSNDYEFHLSKLLHPDETLEEISSITDRDTIIVSAMQPEQTKAKVEMPSWPANFINVEYWWKDVKKGSEYPVYTVLLFDSLDKEATRFFGSYISSAWLEQDTNCGWLVFCNYLEDTPGGWLARTLTSQQKVSQHAKQAYRVAEYFGISNSDIPCALYFEDPVIQDPVLIELKGLSSEEMLDEIRQVNDVIRIAQKKNVSPCGAIKNRKRAKTASGFANKAQRGLGNVAQIAAAPIIDAIVNSL